MLLLAALHFVVSTFRDMLPSCENATQSPIFAILEEPSTTPGTEFGKEDDVLESEVGGNNSQGFVTNAANAAAAVFSSK